MTYVQLFAFLAVHTEGKIGGRKAKVHDSAAVCQVLQHLLHSAHASFDSKMSIDRLPDRGSNQRLNLPAMLSPQRLLPRHEGLQGLRARVEIDQRSYA